MPLKVIGAGFGRTATASLKVALEKLLGEPCYHMSEVLGRAGHVDLWIEAATGKPDWDAVFGGFDLSINGPVHLVQRLLDEAIRRLFQAVLFGDANF